MLDPLLVVDVEPGFINEFTHHLPQRILQLIQWGNYTPILFTRFINPPDAPYYRFLDWHGCQEESETMIVPELQAFARPELIFTKPRCGLPDQLTAYLQQKHCQRVFIVGIDTDMCVLKVAMDLFDVGIEPVVLIDCCASTAGLQAHLAGLAVLSRNIGAQRLWEAGLSNGTLAAPKEVPS